MTGNGGMFFWPKDSDQAKMVSLSGQGRAMLSSIARKEDIRETEVLQKLYESFGGVTEMKIEEYYNMLFRKAN